MSHSHSSESHHDPNTATMAEPDAVDLGAIVKFGIGLAIVLVISHFAMLLTFRSLDSRAAAAEPPRVYPMAVPQDDRRPPEPRLQGGVQSASGQLLPLNEQVEHNAGPKEALIELHAEEDAILDGYSWVDRSANIVRIPIAEAMKMTLQQGLPARTQAPAAAPATETTAATQEQGK